MPKSVVFVVLLFCAIGCKHQEKTLEISSKEVEKFSEVNGVQEQAATRIVGKILGISMDSRYASSDHPCADHPCIAEVEVVALSYLGMDYHGQFEPGTSIFVSFRYTLEPSSNIAPELNPLLEGLDVGDFFEADIRPSMDEAIAYRVDIYTKYQ